MSSCSGQLMQKRNTAFTLVELSIVLVILGLLIGGILTGQSLIHASQLRKVTADIRSYQTAVDSFKEKYFALPGDMTNATAFWGLAGGTGAADGSDTTCYSTVGSGTATCNGNGDGLINGTPGEEGRSWQHLANAGLISGSYPGTYYKGTITATDVPSLAISNGFVVLNNGWSVGPNSATYQPMGNTATYLTIGALPLKALGPNKTPGALLTTEDAWNIDTKLDDGLPQTGSVTAGKTSIGPISYELNCQDGAGNYGLANTGQQCVLAFRVN